MMKSFKKQKTGKKKKPGENPDDEDSPGPPPKNEPAASSNFNPNNPVNLPMQSDSEKELLPHDPTSPGTGSSQRTMQHTDREEDESEDTQSTKQTFKPSNRCGFSHQKYTDKDHVDRLCKNMTDDDRALLVLYSSKQESLKASSTSALTGKKRKGATATETKAYQKQFLEAKHLECKSWLDNAVFDLVDTRKIHVRNWVTGRWVLTLQRDKDGNFLKTKARWVLRGFQDKQKNDQQTDSPAASRSGFRLAIQAAANKGWNIFHMDLKTAFLQGEAYDQNRDIICQIPPEMGYPPHIGARMKKPAYGLNDAPRRWWNVLGSALHSYGLAPTRADRCTYVYYGKQPPKPTPISEKKSSSTFGFEGAVDYLMDPVSGNNAKNRQVHGALSLCR